MIPGKSLAWGLSRTNDGAFSFDGQESSSNMHSVKILFTQFTLLFTIQIPQAEINQSIFVAPALKGCEK